MEESKKCECCSECGTNACQCAEKCSNSDCCGE